MNTGHKSYYVLLMWIIVLIVIGFSIGFFIKPVVGTWYSTLHRSALTPPNYVFSIAWTLLYAMLGMCGWLIWSAAPFASLRTIKVLYAIQLMLNWSWTPLFFLYHATGLSLLVLICMDILVGAIMWLAYPRLTSVSLLMIPYLLWLLFASYLNGHIWMHN